MSVHDSEPGDIYVDEDRKLWRVIAVCREPSVFVEEVERTMIIEPNELYGRFYPAKRQNGGVSGAMWHGFKRIYREDKAE